MRSTILLLTLLPMATGCVREARREFVVPTADEAPRDPSEVREIAVADDGPVDEAPGPIASAVVVPPARPTPLEPVLFRLGAGYGALAHIDLTPCREEGLPPGYLHVRVTFRHSGRVVRAAVESAVAPPSEALACIGEQLEVTMVPLFEGGDVTLSKSFFVN